VSETVRAIAILVGAALLEVGGDALVRWGLKNGRVLGLAAGAAVLFLYGLSVNLPKWDFGKLMGVYIALFFGISQLMAAYIFHEKPAPTTLLGGILILTGGLVVAFGRGGFG